MIGWMISSQSSRESERRRTDDQDCRKSSCRIPASYIGLISISDGMGIGFGQRLTHATASSRDGSSQSQ